MNLKKKQSLIAGVVLVLIMISAELLTGCTNNTERNDYTNAVVRYPVLSSIDSTILNNAYDEYEILKNNMSYEEARLQLLEKLNNETGVEKAELGLDNYTIFITYSDGDFAAVDTFELNGDYQQIATGFSSLASGGSSDNEYLTKHTITFDGSSEQYDSASEYSQSGINEIQFATDEGSPEQKTTCASKKVLVLGPCYWEFPTQPTDDCINLFKEQGWTNDDMTIKLVRIDPSKENTDCMLLTPDDFFNLKEYGIILFVGHGTVKVFKNYDKTNLYLQFCYLNNASFVQNPLFKQWKNESKLIIFREYTTGQGNSSQYIYSTAIRADVLEEMIKGPLPSSYIHLATCYSSFFNNIFLSKGAKMMSGWNNLVIASYADANMKNMVSLMLQNDSCVYDAFADNSIVKSYKSWDPENPTRGLTQAFPDQSDRPDNVIFNLYPDPLSDQTSQVFYFPAWFDKITVTGIPDEADSVSVTLISNAGISLASESYSVSSTTLSIEDLDDVVFPATETPTIQVKALDGNGKELLTGQAYCVVSAGANSKQVNLTGYEDKTYAEYTYGSSYQYKITIDLTASSNEWETGKDITATAICTIDPIADGPDVGVPGFQIIFQGVNGEVVSYDPPIVGGTNFGQSNNGRDPGVEWGAPPVEGWWGSPATFTATFRLESKETVHPCILARCMWSSWGETDWTKIYIR
jgi:hypothetical protein